MPSVFSRILAGELPARFVYRDEMAAAFLTIAPVRPGHVLVVPVPQVDGTEVDGTEVDGTEVDDWLDLDDATAAHLMAVARRVGRAVRSATGAARVGMVIAGFEVPHVHLHLIPADSLADLDFAAADPAPDLAEMDRVRGQIEAALASAP